MATELIARIIDDLDRTVIEDGQGVRLQFTYENKTYQLDLTHANAELFHEQMRFWADRGMVVSSKKKPKSRGPQLVPELPQTAQAASKSRKGIRQWARERGYDISDKGQVPREITRAFDLAHSA